MSLPPKDAERRELARRATPGPWYWELYRSSVATGFPQTHAYKLRTKADDKAPGVILTMWEQSFSSYPKEEDRKFIASANPAAVLKLLERIEKLRAAIQTALGSDAMMGAGDIDVLTEALEADDRASEKP